MYAMDAVVQNKHTAWKFAKDKLQRCVLRCKSAGCGVEIGQTCTLRHAKICQFVIVTYFACQDNNYL